VPKDHRLVLKDLPKRMPNQVKQFSGGGRLLIGASTYPF
jgi:hypothetical protein